MLELRLQARSGAAQHSGGGGMGVGGMGSGLGPHTIHKRYRRSDLRIPAPRRAAILSGRRYFAGTQRSASQTLLRG